MIHIKNVFHMLSYAFRVLQEKGYQDIAAEDFEHIEDLFAAILIIGITGQIKRGLYREYENKEEILKTPRGKIEISASIKENTWQLRRVVCHRDEFTENTYMNRILKTAVLLLLRSNAVKRERRACLRNQMGYLGSIEVLNPIFIDWQSLRYHRNNATYRMLMNICRFVIQGMLLTTESGDKKVSDFVDDQKMYRLYERFVLEFYRLHFPQLGAASSQIEWNIDDGFDDFLPVMKSDIMLSYQGKTLIIDTKYYSQTMQYNPLFDSRSIISQNLYQIFTYVKNKDPYASGDVSGLLLYAKTDEALTPDADYAFGGNRISVKTLDLGQDWQGIVEQLNLIGAGLVD
ncbi:MAG: 5-methylcytosine-specific restriction endonuclease system specificity protein McrC [Coriobacteriaceae bacterium]|nr:5-methylcytosine-specific restriction endonuclease system specificity protein McrC [Coriobacteriaceae bacterium]